MSEHHYDKPALDKSGPDVLADAVATSRRLATKFGLTDKADLYGDHCTNCERRWALPADEASCAHIALCEDCWPNGCEDCERQVEADLRHREKATHRILSAALELRTGADDLSETDLRKIDWRVRGDLVRHVGLTIEALRRIEDTLRAQEKA